MPKLSEEDLKKLAFDAVSDAKSYIDTDVGADRAKSLDRYFRASWNEQQGRSKVQTSDVQDTISWIMPQLMKIFTSTNDIVEFKPDSREDEQYCKQASEYVNHIIMEDNDGFNLIHDWIWDALVQKNGIVKAWWSEDESFAEDEYQGLTEAQLVALVDDEDVEVLEQAEGDAYESIDQMGMTMYLPTWDVRIRRRNVDAGPKIECIPPEEFLINRSATSMDDARFVGHMVEKTRSDLVAEGYDREKVNQIPTGNDLSWTDENQARYEDIAEALDDAGQMASEEVVIVEAYIYADANDDGISELHQVVLGGGAGGVLLSTEVVDEVPFHDITSIRIPHRFFGSSIADVVQEIQEARSTLWRQMLDNLYLTNYPQIEVPKDARDSATISDLKKRLPGGFVRTKQGGLLNPLVVPFTASSSLPMDEKLISERESRSGVNKMSQGISPDSLQRTAKDATLMYSASQSKIDLIARMIAGGGMKSLCQHILRLVCRHQDWAREVKIGKDWVEVDPRHWNAYLNMEVNLGLGTGTQEQRIGVMRMIADKQESIIAGMGMDNPIVTPVQYYNTLKALVREADMKDPDLYFVDPTQAIEEAKQKAAQQPQGEQVNPLVQAEQVKAQQRMQEAQMRHQQKMAELQSKQQAEQARIQLDWQDREDRQQFEAELNASKLAFEAQQAELDRDLKREIEGVRIAQADQHRAADILYMQGS